VSTAANFNGAKPIIDLDAESIDSSMHGEWHEALAETFPASDPISPSIGALS